MADGDKDILQLHFGIDIRDAETKINSIKDSLANIVDFGKLKHQIRTASQMLQQAELGLSSSKNAQSPLDNYLEKIREFRRGIERIRQDAYAVPRHVTKEMTDAADAMTKSANAFEEAYKRLFGAASIGAVASIPVDEKATKNLGMQVEMTTKLADAARNAQEHLSALVKDIQAGYSQGDSTSISKRLLASLNEFQSLQNDTKIGKIKLSIDVDNIVKQLQNAVDVFSKKGTFSSAYLNYMQLAQKVAKDSALSQTSLRVPADVSGFGIEKAIDNNNLDELYNAVRTISLIRKKLRNIYGNQEDGGVQKLLGDTDSPELADWFTDFNALEINKLAKTIQANIENGGKEIPKSIANAARKIQTALKGLYLTFENPDDWNLSSIVDDRKMHKKLSSEVVKKVVRGDEYFNSLLRKAEDPSQNAINEFINRSSLNASESQLSFYIEAIRKLFDSLGSDSQITAKKFDDAFSKMFLTINRESKPELFEQLKGLLSLDLSDNDIGAIANTGKVQDAAKAVATMAESAKQAGTSMAGGFAGVIPMLNGLAVAVNAIPGDGGTKISGLASSITKLKDAMSGLGNADTIDLSEYVKKIGDAFAGISADGKQSPYTLPAPTIAPVSDENIARYVADSISKIRSAFEGGKQDGSEAKSISVPVNFNTDKSITDLNSRIQSVRDMLAGNPIKVKVTLDTAQYAAELQNTDLTTPAENAASLKAREDLLKGVALPVTSVNVATVKKAIGIATLNRNYTLLENVSLPVTTISVARVKDAVGRDALSDNFRLLADVSLPVSNLDVGRVTSVFNTDKLGPTYLANVALPVTSIDVSTVTKVKGKNVLKKNDALLADVAIKAPTIGAIDTKPLDTLREKITWLNENPLNVSFAWLSDDNLTRVKEFAQSVREVASSLKYLQDLEKTLEKIGAEQNAALKNMAKRKSRDNAPADVGRTNAMIIDANKAGLDYVHDAIADANTRKAQETYKDVQHIWQRSYSAVESVQAQLNKLFRMPWEAEGWAVGETPMSRLEEAARQASARAPFLLEDDLKSLDTYKAMMLRVHDAVDGTRTSVERFKGELSNTNNVLNSKPNLAPYTKSIQEMRKSYNDMIQSIRNGNIGAIGGGGMNIAGLDVTALKRLQAEMRTTGDSFTEMMRTMGFYITGRSVITFFQNAIKSASQFSMEIRRIQSLATTFDFDRIKTGLESLDARFGNLIHNAKALYWAFSSGVRGTEEELVRFTETMSKTAITIGSDVMPVMDAATTLMNAYGKSAASAGEISDLLFTIVKEGKANGQQLASSIGNIIAPASAMGLTFKDIGATISTLTRTMKTNNALTYLNNILAKMNNPTKEVQSQLDKLGLEINATAIKAKGFAQVMREIHEATRGDINLIAKIFPDIRGQRAAVTLFSTQFGEFQKQLENFGNMEGNMQEALSKITDNPEAQFAALRNGFEMIRQAAGDAAINVVTLGGALTPLFSAVNGMKSFGRSVAGHIAGLAALGVVMNMLGKAKLMLESANISSIQQMNLAYNEQTSLIAQSIMSKREQIAAEEANKAAAMETWHAEQLANNATYADIKDKIELLSVQEKLVKQRKVELDLQLAILKKDADAVKFVEDRWVTQQKQMLAYERLKGANDAARGIPIQWAMQDQLKEARNLVTEWNKETRLLGYQSGLKTGDLNSIVAKAMTEAVNGGAEPEIIKQIEAAAKQAKINIERTLLERIVAGVRMEHQVSVMNRDFNEIIKNGDLANNPNAFSSLALKMNTLNADILNRFQVAVQTEADLRKLYTSHGMSEAEASARIENLNNELQIVRELTQAERMRMEIEMSVGGAAYKFQLDAAKALAQRYASENKIHAANIQNIISETVARVKNAAAQRDAAKAEAEAMRGRQRLNDYIVQNNLQLGKQKKRLDELIQSYRQLAVASNAAFQWKQTPVTLAEQIARQRYLQTGQFNNESGAWRGAWAAANAAAQNAHISNFLNKLSFLPGIGGMVGMFVRPFSMFYKEFVKLGGVILQGSSAVVKGIAVWRTANAVIGRNIAMGQKLTAWQALANTSVSRFAGTIMGLHIGSARTIGQMAALGHAAKTLGISVKGLQTAMWMLAGVGGVAILAISGITAGLVLLTDNGGPLRKLANWMEGLNSIKQRGTALDSILGMVKDVATRRNDFEQRRQYLLAELDYRRWTGQVIGETNGVDAMIIRQREQQLRNVKFEKNIESERLSQLSKQYKDVYGTAESLFNRYEVTYQDSFLRQLWNVSTTLDWRKLTFPTEMYRIINDMVRMQKASRELRGLDVDIDTERFASQQLVPSAIATLRSHEMLLEMENNTADVMAQEQNNAMRQLALETKRNLTLRRMSILTGGKSPYMKMYEVAKAEETARAKKEAADFKLQKMLENGISADSETYKTQSALAEQLGKELERAENAANNFHTSYVNYRKQQAQQLLDQIKLDGEIAEQTRKSTYQDLDRQAMLGGNYAEAAKLEAQFKDAQKLVDEAAKRNAAITIDAYKKQYTAISKTLPSMYADVTEKEAARDRAKSALLALGRDASDEERSKAMQAYEKARSEATGARNALNQTNAELRNLASLAEKAKKMPLTEKELYEIRQREMDAAKNLSNFWKKVLDDMTNVVKTSKNAIDDIQVNRIRGVIGGERRLPAMSRRDVSAYRERLFRARTEEEAREIRMQYRREAILRNPSQGLGSTFAKANVLKNYVNEAIIRDQREFMQLQKGLAERGGMMGPDERSRTLARMRELQDSITKGMETYIGVQGDLVKRQKEARNGILQLAQSLQKFRSVAVDAVDSLSSEAFSMRFRSFSGLKELPQMRTTTAEERSMYGNMERKDAWGTMANEVMAAFATRYGEDAKKRYETAIKGLDAPANTFKTAAETFDRAVQRPLAVNVNAVDVFGGRL